MKKLLLIALLFCLKQLNAQCPININGYVAVCAGGTTTLTASGATNYTWMPSGVQTATIAITPTATTVYTVTGTTGTCTATNTITVSINNNPVLSFTANHPCDGSPVYFTNTTPNQGSFTAWHWDFGDGAGTSTSVAPSGYTYTAAGCYSVALTATNSVGCTGSHDTTVYVHSNPYTSFNAFEVCLGNVSAFVDGSFIQSPTCLHDSIISWHWDFGDGGATTFNNTNKPDTVKHTYALCGPYNITLTVTTNNNCTNAGTLMGDTVFCLPQLTAPQNFSVCPGAATPVQTFTTTCANGGTAYAQWFQSFTNVNNTGAPSSFISTGGTNHVPSYNAIAQNLSCGLLSDSVFAVAVSGVGCVGAVLYYTANVYPTPTVTPINNISVCANQTVCVPAFTTACSIYTTYTWSAIVPGGVAMTGTGNMSCFAANSIGNSTVDVTPSSNGCVGPNSTFTISVYSYPTLTVTTNHPILCLGFADTLIASGATTYTWNTMETGASIVVTPTTTTVNYTVTGSNNGCISTYTFTENPAICEGINSFANNINITLYPNPNNGNFVIETTSIEKQTLQIVDVTGKLVLQQTISGKTIIDASSLDNGIYFVQINTGEGFFTKKIIVQR